MRPPWIPALIGAMIFAQCTVATAQTAADPPHAFPREGAIQVFDNAWGTAWNVTWTPNKPTPLHRHLHDYVGVELVDSSVALTSPGQPARTAALKRGQSYFFPKGVTHVEEGLAVNPPRHAVLIDLKDVTVRTYANTTAHPDTPPADSARKVLENPRVTMWERIWAPGQAAAMTFQSRDAFVMVVDGGELTVTTSDAPPQVLTLSPGQVLFNPGGRARAEQATKGTVRAIVVELK